MQWKADRGIREKTKTYMANLIKVIGASTHEFSAKSPMKNYASNKIDIIYIDDNWSENLLY